MTTEGAKESIFISGLDNSITESDIKGTFPPNLRIPGPI